LGKKSGDTREEEGAAAKNRKPREEEGPSEPWSVRSEPIEDQPFLLLLKER
jgi:hypothetical protein